MTYKKLGWWPNAYRVLNDDGDPIGCVSSHQLIVNGKERTVWNAHSYGMITMNGLHKTRKDAAAAIPSRRARNTALVHNRYRG